MTKAELLNDLTDTILKKEIEIEVKQRRPPRVAPQKTHHTYDSFGLSIYTNSHEHGIDKGMILMAKELKMLIEIDKWLPEEKI